MTSAANLYHSVISDVVSSIRESFLDESVDENVLQELKTLWTQKLDASKTVDHQMTSAAASRITTDQHLDSKMTSALANARAAVAVAPPPHHGRASSSARSAPAQRPPPPPPTASGPLVITNPNRLVAVQITIPAQPGNPHSQPRALTVNVPAHALQTATASSQLLQTVLTEAISRALQLPESHAAIFLQSQINSTFKL